MAKVPATTRSAIGIGEKFVGHIVHYYPRINVGIVELTDGDINLGDVIHVQGKQTNLVQPLDSIQMDHLNVTSAEKGRSVAIKVKDRVRNRDKVGVARWILLGS